MVTCIEKCDYNHQTSKWEFCLEPMALSDIAAVMKTSNLVDIAVVYFSFSAECKCSCTMLGGVTGVLVFIIIVLIIYIIWLRWRGKPCFLLIEMQF